MKFNVTGLSPPVKYFTDRSKAVLLLWIFYVFVLSCVCYVLCASVYMCFVVTCWERADLLALVCGVFSEFVTFPLVSWVRCGTWLYRFLIFATLLTLILTDFWSLHPYLLCSRTTTQWRYLSCFGRNFWNVLTPIHIIRDSYTKILYRLNVFQGLVVKGIVKEYVFVMLMPSHSHWVTFGHIEFHLPIGFPLS